MSRFLFIQSNSETFMLSDSDSQCKADALLAELGLLGIGMREGVTLLFSGIDSLPTHHYQCDVT